MNTTPQREIRVSFNVVRVDAAKREVTGEVYVPFDPQPGVVYPLDEINSLVDTWGTFMRPASLERLAKEYLTDCRRVDRMHDRKTRAGEPVECWIARSEPDFTTGAWAVTIRVVDEVWEADVATGILKAFSFDIMAGRVPTEIRVSGHGQTVDLNGVTQWPFIPKTVTVDGEATLRLDELVDPTPNYVSLVDAGGNRRQFEARAELRFYQEGQMAVAPVVVTDPVTAPLVEAVAAPSVPVPAPVVEERTPAVAPVAEDEQERRAVGWFQRVIVAPMLRALGRDPLALNPDGTLPPTLPAPATLTAPAVRWTPKEPIVSTTASTAVVETKNPLVARLVRYMGMSDGPMSFDEEWAEEDVNEEVCEATSLLYSVLWSILDAKDSYASTDAMLQACAAQMSAYLSALDEIYQGLDDNAKKVSRSQVAIRSLALLLATAEYDTDEQRAGKKYSAATQKKLKAAYEKATAAYEELAAIVKEAMGETEQKTAAPAPAAPVAALAATANVDPPAGGGAETKRSPAEISAAIRAGAVLHLTPAEIDGLGLDDAMVIRATIAKAMPAEKLDGKTAVELAQLFDTVTTRSVASVTSPELDAIAAGNVALEARIAAASVTTTTAPAATPAPPAETPIQKAIREANAKQVELEARLAELETRRQGSAQPAGTTAPTETRKVEGFAHNWLRSIAPRHASGEDESDGGSK